MPEHTYFEARERALLGARYDEVYRPQGEVRRALTRNALRCSEARFLQLMGPSVCRAPFCADSFYLLDETVRPGKSPLYHAGAYYVQEASAAAPAPLLDVQPGQRVLDMCAAPGGKTAVMSEMMGDTGRVYAWDTHAHRVELIRGTINRLKLENVRPAVKDASVPREEMAMTLDAALVDVPCSGTGVMNEKPDVKYRVTEEGVQALCRTQKDILDAVAPMVKVGGTLVYSTCSILPQENEAQIKAFLERHPEYEVWPMGAELPEKLAAHENACGLQMFAHRDGTDGFYVCRMRRVKA